MMRKLMIATAFGAAFGAALLGCCGLSRPRITIEIPWVNCSDVRTELDRAKEAFRVYGFVMDSYDVGPLNGDGVQLRIVGRPKTTEELYVEELLRNKRLRKQIDGKGESGKKPDDAKEGK